MLMRKAKKQCLWSCGNDILTDSPPAGDDMDLAVEDPVILHILSSEVLDFQKSQGVSRPVT